jgi:hypothetical protein
LTLGGVGFIDHVMKLLLNKKKKPNKTRLFFRIFLTIIGRDLRLNIQAMIINSMKSLFKRCSDAVMSLADTVNISV